jgi:ABC-2 type transport system ATP-binding protein
MTTTPTRAPTRSTTAVRTNGPTRTSTPRPASATGPATGADAAIVVNGLRKHYGDLRAVDGVSFEVGSGEFFGILGPNGAGKTTTLEIIEGLREADAGTVTVLGQRPWPRNPRLLPRLGVQLQASSFFERLTTREQIRTFASLYGVPTRRADEWLSAVGLTDAATTQAEKLSGGQKQRLSIACALAHDPELVFLDEPTAGLDPQARRNLWDLLREINGRGRTVVLTTHFLDEAEALCDRVAIMDTGRILELGAPATLVRGLDAPTRISIDSGLVGARQAAGLFGDADVVDDGVSLTVTTREPAPVLATLAERGALAGLSVRKATLEDVFLNLTGREYRA